MKKPKVSERWHILFIGLFYVAFGLCILKADEILKRGIVLGGIFIILGLLGPIVQFFWGPNHKIRY